MRRSSTLLCIVVLLVAASSAYIVLSNSLWNNGGESPVLVETMDYPFRLTMTLEKTVYKRGEPVNITISLINIGDKNVRVSLIGWSKNSFNFSIYNQWYNLIYEYDSTPWVTGGPLVSLAPNQSITAMYQWGQKKNDESVVAGGRYSIKSRTTRNISLFEFPEYGQSIIMETPRLYIIIKR